MLPLRPPSARDDAGSALVAVIGVAAVAAVVAATLVASTLFGTGATSATRAGVQAQAAAEAGIDATLAAMAAATQVSSYPDCTPTAATPVGSGSASTGTYERSVAYYTSGDATGTATAACGRTSAVRSARITSTGTARDRGVTGNTTGDTHTMEAVVTVDHGTVSAARFPHAFYGADMALVPRLDVTSENSTVATSVIDQKGTTVEMDCNRGATTGNVVVRNGSLTLRSSNCEVRGDLWVGGVLTAVHGSSLRGNISATGSMDLSDSTNTALVLQPEKAIRAGGAVRWAPGCTTANRCHHNLGAANVPAPAVQAPLEFLTDETSLAVWESRGFQRMALDCTGGAELTAKRIIDAVATSSATGLLVRTDCPLIFKNSWSPVHLGRDLALLTSSTVTFNAMEVRATSPRRLYLIGTGITSSLTMTGTFLTAPTVSSFIQAPTVALSGGIELYGQLVGTTKVSGANNVDVTYRPMDLHGTATGSTPATASVSLALKRDVTS